MPAAVLAADAPISSAGHLQLILAALAGIATVVLLVAAVRLHPFLALLCGSAVLALVAWIPGADAITSFTDGFGTTSGAVGLLIALGAMLGRLLSVSGGADRVVESVVGRMSARALPWGMALIAALVGLPMFFEIGVVILVPIVVLVAQRTKTPLMLVGIPALAGLSILHGLVPPHPGPETAISALHADQGYTLLFGLLVAVPTLVISGPLLARVINEMVPVDAAGLAARGTGGARATDDAENSTARTPRTGAALAVVLTPVVLMLPAAVGNLVLADGNTLRSVLDVIGTPSVALFVAVAFAYVVLGRGSGMTRQRTSDTLGDGLAGVAGIMLIVAAGGGFKQLLVDSGIAKVIADWATDAHLSVLVLGWLVAVAIRLATGSATVATVTAAGIVGGLAATLSTTHVSLLVLAIGCGSLFFSHVNDAGFWLVKEYFGLSVGQTLRSWSLMETVISVVGFAFVLLLSVFV
ncbi:GntP family permease [Allobranchiibius sp. GilTou73]|uniref:GntP family permease n=1 Tax=Allobranchiibius sp. GilTou73 TaxID=2904523 RepID=UPI001F44D4D2|nr:gluconate:H+ symporter [Allobranchiibius sp. GilTou73]UIJ34814.1 GntP family permease [Allobranchiibius sp. GilTou73]